MHEIVKNVSGFWLLLFDHDGLDQTLEGASSLYHPKWNPQQVCDHLKDKLSLLDNLTCVIKLCKLQIT